MHRSVDLANRFGARLMLVDVVHDSSVTYGALVPRADIDEGRLALLDSANTKLSQLARVLSEGSDIVVETEVIWDHDRYTGILDKAKTGEADLIIKERGNHSYVLGLFSNTDWELLRESDVSVRFVNPDESVQLSNCITAAVELSFEDRGADEKLSLDYRAFDSAKYLSDIYNPP